MKADTKRASDAAVALLTRRRSEVESNTYLLALATYAMTMANSNIKDQLRAALDRKAKGEGRNDSTATGVVGWGWRAG